MNMSRILPALLLSCLLWLPAQAQWGTSPVTLTPDAGDGTAMITSMQLDFTQINLGEIVKGTQFKYEIGFTNTGDADLVLEGVKPSCNCSHPEFSTEPVKPGKKGVITVLYDTKDKTPGAAEGTITIIYNGMPNIEQVHFEAMILPAATEEVPPPQEAPQHNE